MAQGNAGSHILVGDVEIVMVPTQADRGETRQESGGFLNQELEPSLAETRAGYGPSSLWV